MVKQVLEKMMVGNQINSVGSYALTADAQSRRDGLLMHHHDAAHAHDDLIYGHRYPRPLHHVENHDGHHSDDAHGHQQSHTGPAALSNGDHKGNLSPKNTGRRSGSSTSRGTGHSTARLTDRQGRAHRPVEPLSHEEHCISGHAHHHSMDGNDDQHHHHHLGHASAREKLLHDELPELFPSPRNHH